MNIELTRGHVRYAVTGLVGAAAIVAVALTAGCASTRTALTEEVVPRSVAVTGPIELKKVEVRQYKGKDLSSVDDFRENSIEGPQEVDLATYTLKVDGKVLKPLELTYDEVLARQRYEKVVRLNCVEGWSVDILWEGVLLKDLLEQAGYSPQAKTLIFRCYDGYSTSLPLDYIIDNDILLAFKMNGIEMPTERGFPFQVVAQDRYGYKWAKWVTSIEVSDDTEFRGYWEQRGYDNDAKLPGAK